MKRIKAITGIVALLLVAVALVALAGSVYDRTTATLGTATGTVTWTNTQKYAAVELKRIWIEGDLVAADTVTVYRVTSDNAYTQACASVTVAASDGNSASFTAAYLKYGDKLPFSSGIATGSTAMIEYIVQEL